MKTSSHDLALAFSLGALATACGSEAPPGTEGTNTSSSTTTATSGAATSGGGASSSGTTDSSTTTAGTTTAGPTSGSTTDAGTTGASTTGGAMRSNYYPVVDGSVTVYQHNSAVPWEETVTLTEISPGVFREASTGDPDGERTDAILQVDASGRVLRTSKEVFDATGNLTISVVYDPGFVRFDPAWLDLAVNESVTLDYQRTETPAGGAPDPTRARSHIYTHVGIESVTILGTSYSECLVVHRARNYTDVAGGAEDQEKQFHFCPDVGKVQEVNIESESTEQLVSYTQ